MEEKKPATPATTTESQTPKPKAPSPQKQRMYPELSIPYPQHPNRWYAFPFIGILVKAILLIPVLFFLIFLGLFNFILMLITPFVILFTGKYWDTAYKYTLIYLRVSTKVSLYIFGLTDTYPGFSMDEGGLFTLRLDKPVAPSRFLAFPLLGFLIRAVLLIPFSIFSEVLSRGSAVALVCSWFAVLFTGKYPESFYEFIKDTIRVSNAESIYQLYLSDTYPSFNISMHHKMVKIILLILGVLLVIGSYVIQGSNRSQHTNQYNYSSPTSNTTY